MTPEKQSASDLRDLQNEIYRERVLRARRLTEEQRFADGISLTNAVFKRMHEGAMWQLGTSDPEEGWREVRKRMKRLQKTEDHGFYTSELPAAS